VPTNPEIVEDDTMGDSSLWRPVANRSGAGEARPMPSALQN